MTLSSPTSPLRRRLFGLAAVLLAATLPAVGAPAWAAKPAVQLSPADAEAAARAEAYLNEIQTLKGRFLQMAPDGTYAEGTVAIARPGRMRLDYDPPTPIQVVADGKMLVYYDRQLKQTSYLGLDQTPAGLLLRPKVDFDGKDLAVTSVARAQGVVAVTVVKASDPGMGALTLVFQDSPYQLRQWKVTDPQGQVTTVQLFDARTNVPVDMGQFRFVDPDFKPEVDLNRSR